MSKEVVRPGHEMIVLKLNHKEEWLKWKFSGFSFLLEKDLPHPFGALFFVSLFSGKQSLRSRQWKRLRISPKENEKVFFMAGTEKLLPSLLSWKIRYHRSSRALDNCWRSGIASGVWKTFFPSSSQQHKGTDIRLKVQPTRQIKRRRRILRLTHFGAARYSVRWMRSRVRFGFL